MSGTKISGYEAKDIVFKEGLEGIKQNPSMYIGDDGVYGFHHLASEIIDNSVDEALAGHATKITIILNKDGSCSVEDDGRGIPTDVHPIHKISTLELVLTRIHAGGKFEKKAYQTSGGLHGIGAKAANALSEWLEATVFRDGKQYFQRYVEGKPVADVKSVGDSKLRGTKIHFKPSLKIFRGVTGFDREWFLKRLRDLAYLNPGVIFRFEDLREDPKIEHEFVQKGGISDYVKALLTGPSLLREPFCMSALEADGYVKDDGSQDEMRVDLAFNYGDADTETTLAFTNNIFNKDGGTHVTGFQTALTTAFNNYLKKNPDLISKKEQKDLEGKTLRGEDYRNGLVAIISVRLARPRFSSQTKERLTTMETQGAVRTAVGQVLNKWIEENPALAKKVVEKAVLSFRSHLASKKAAETIKKESKSLLGGDSKLKDCTIEDPEKSELFIVEGDSAGGSAVDGRDPAFQAILPLGGKILNTWKATPAKMLEHEEINSLIRALGAGILDTFEPEKCRYGKIIVMCDADVDGLHIRTLLLTFFFQRMRKLIEDGRVYIAQPPLYGIEHLHKKTKCEHCKGTKKLAGNNCTGCAGSGRQQEYITYDAEFYSTMTKLGLENPVMTVPSGEVIKGDKFKAIFKACSAKDAIAELTTLGFNVDEIKALKLPPGQAAPERFSLTNEAGAKAVKFTHLLGLPQAVIQLGQNCVKIKRFKGLGEMNDLQLWHTTMNPATRSLLQITIQDFVNANGKFEILMGNKADVRREFISAKKAY